MADSPYLASLEASIVRVAYYYCQMNDLASTLRRVVLEGRPLESNHREEVLTQYERARRSSDHLYAELQRLTLQLTDNPPTAPRNGAAYRSSL